MMALISFVVDSSIGLEYKGQDTCMDKPLEKIRFQVKKPRAHYIQTKPIHPSQRLVEESDEYMLFQIEVIPNKELQSVFLSFGEDLILV